MSLPTPTPASTIVSLPTPTPASTIVSLPTPTPAPTLQVSSFLLTSETPIESLAVLTDLLNASVEIFPTATTSIEEAVPSLPSTTTIALLTSTPAPSLLILASLSLSEASSGPPDILSTSVVEIFPTPTISMEEASSSEQVGFSSTIDLEGSVSSQVVEESLQPSPSTLLTSQVISITSGTGELFTTLLFSPSPTSLSSFIEETPATSPQLVPLTTSAAEILVSSSQVLLVEPTSTLSLETSTSPALASLTSTVEAFLPAFTTEVFPSSILQLVSSLPASTAPLLRIEPSTSLLQTIVSSRLQTSSQEQVSSLTSEIIFLPTVLPTPSETLSAVATSQLLFSELVTLPTPVTVATPTLLLSTPIEGGIFTVATSTPFAAITETLAPTPSFLEESSQPSATFFVVPTSVLLTSSEAEGLPFTSEFLPSLSTSLPELIIPSTPSFEVPLLSPTPGFSFPSSLVEESPTSLPTTARS